jgi:diaminohydroxyphosphoribosylaminopyrimidine deaminase/5-amino-6-(5-phosphoribosylamino)uracil reductase
VGTVLADDPALTSHGQGRNPLRVVLDSRGRTPKGARVLDASAPTVVYTRRTVAAGNGRLDLRAVLKDLASRGVGTLMVEGGPGVIASFLKARLADEVRVFVAPGAPSYPGAKRLFRGSGIASLVKALRLTAPKVTRVGPDLLVSGKVAR